MKLLIAARLNSEYKLRTTLEPILQLPMIEQAYLVRRYPIDLPKTTCYSPPPLLRKSIVTTELYRIWKIFFLCLFKRPNGLMGIHFIFHCVYTALAKIIFRIPLIMLIIESPEKYQQHSVFNFFMRRADLVGVRGNRSRQYLMETAGIPEAKIFVTPDVHRFQRPEEIKASENSYDLVFVGYYTKAKRIDILLEVVDRIRKERPDIRLALVGEGPLHDSVVQKIDKLRLQKNVDRLGHVKSIYPYLKSSKIFVMTSQTEGLPTVMLEALGFGLPFVVPDVGDIRDLARDNYNAIVVKKLDVQAFADACLKLLNDEEYYKKMHANACAFRDELKDRHRFESVQKLWEEKLRGTLK